MCVVEEKDYLRLASEALVSTSSTFHPASCAYSVGPLQLRAAKTEGFSVSVAASTLPGELDRQLITSVYYISPYS